MSKRNPPNEMPAPSEDGPAGDLPSFLRVTDIGKKIGDKGTVTFLGKAPRPVSSDYGVQFAFPVKVGGTVYDWTIKVDSGNHRRLFDRFGKKPPTGAIKVEVKEYNGKLYIAIV